MSHLETSIFDFRQIDDLSYKKTPIHNLDPRVKLITSLVFIIMVVSFDKYEISAFIPFIIYPLYILVGGEIPLLIILKKCLVVLPFAFIIGIFNPIFDFQLAFQIGPLPISYGWVSFMSIILRFFLTVSTALALIAVTGFYSLCQALEKLGLPQIFVTQLLFLYRYIFVLLEEAIRMNRARALRSVNNKKMSITLYKNLIGCLLLRTLERAQRIHAAMYCRGFNGSLNYINKLKLNRFDLVFLFLWLSILAFLRMYNIPQYLGHLFL